MANVQCKMCGGCLSLPDGVTSSTCEYCGSLVTFPKITNNDMESLYNRAEHFRNIHEYDKALDVYEKIVDASPDDADAYWGLVLCRYGIEYVEDPVSHERIPTCHRVQYESILADPDYLSALEKAGSAEKDMYTAEAQRISEIQKGILAVSNQEDPYDVFICYKESDDSGARTRDSVVAQDIYYALTNENLKVFFARITLESKLGSQYEPCIFAALNSAKVMLVVGSKKEYFEAVWVKNEWSRFLSMLKKDRSKILIPCYKDMDAYDIPQELSMFQAQDMGKIGFIQDLLHGIKKVVSKPQVNVAAAAVPVAVPAAAPAPVAAEAESIETMLKSAKYMLMQGKFSDARKKCKAIVKRDPDNCWGYWYMLLAESMVTEAEKADIRVLKKNSSYEFVVKIADAELRAIIESLESKYEAYQQKINQVGETLQQKCSWAGEYIAEAKERRLLLERHFSLERALSGDTPLAVKLSNAMLQERNNIKVLERACSNIAGLLADAGKGRISEAYRETAWGELLASAGLSEEGLQQVQLVNKQILASCGTVEAKQLQLDHINMIKRQKRIKAAIRLFAVVAALAVVTVVIFFSLKNRVENNEILTENFLKADSSNSVLEECFFHGASGINETIVIPDIIKCIKATAFAATAPFERLIISGEVETIEKGAFDNCVIGRIEFGEGSPYYYDSQKRAVVRKAGNELISALPVLAPDKKNVIKANGECIVPHGTANIDAEAFKNCTNLKRVVLPSTILSIGDRAFYGCTNLSDIVVKEDVVLGENVFAGCVSYHRKKAEQGDAEAQYFMGAYYYYGEGVEQDYTEAVKWFTLAAEKGVANAKYDLGRCYFIGSGVAEDKKKALELLEQASAQGHVAAKLEIGKYYIGKSGYEDKVFALLSYVASQENLEAAYYVGLCYANGYGAPKAADKAFEYYMKAGSNGYVPAMREVGKCYSFGRGVERDFDKASSWLEKAAKLDDVEAQYYLGLYLEATSDFANARYWLKKAADKGHAKAAGRLAGIAGK